MPHLQLIPNILMARLTRQVQEQVILEKLTCVWFCSENIDYV